MPQSRKLHDKDRVTARSGGRSTGGRSNSGSRSNTGGRSNSGSRSNTGGRSNSGSRSNTGGRSNSGSRSNTGGRSNSGSRSRTGDRINSGSNAGGKSNTGGRSNSGSRSRTGDRINSGSNAGGKSNTGGRSNSGSNAGGKSNTGGRSNSGSNAGGKSNTGGRSNSGSNAGGKSNTGGRSNSGSNAGGKSNTGGRSNSGSNAGGKSNTGGRSNSGSNAGGKSNTGGRSNSGSNAGGKSNTGGRSNSGSNAGGKSKNPKMAKNANTHNTPRKSRIMSELFVGLDVHKKTIQVSVMDQDGREQINQKIPNTPENIRSHIGSLPKGAKLVMESSSVWKGPFFQIRDKLGMDVMLSNPVTTKLIAESKKKTDKVDARILADMLRGGYIMGCHVAGKQSSDNRDLVRHRYTLIRHRTSLKNSVHGILLQRSVKFGGTPFSRPWVAQASRLKDYRIDTYMNTIRCINDQVHQIDARIRAAVKECRDARLIQTIPGIGAYSALVIAAEIDGIGRFLNAKKLAAYAGIVSSVRSSGDAVHYGPITHKGSSIMRWVLTECTLVHLRYAPSSDITVFYNRLAKKRGNSKATVAAAAKMLRTIYWMLKEKRAFVTNYDQDVGCDDHCGSNGSDL